MAWWNDILGLLRDEFQSIGGSAAGSASEPPTIKQAQTLLKRTSRELGEARARAEAGRRRLLRAQSELEALTRAPDQHPRYRNRLIELARVVAQESELIQSFDTHIAQLDQIHDRIEAQLSRLQRDLDMARNASASARATQQVEPTPAAKAASGDGTKSQREPGFRQQRSPQLMDQLRQVPGDERAHDPAQTPSKTAATKRRGQDEA
jgi:uncharacterized coiled-coil protein SlyX